MHLAYAGTPIIGDIKYGDDYANRHYRDMGLHRLFLHARSLSFKRTDTGEVMNINAPMDDELESILKVLRA